MICFLDIDGTIADAAWRFERAGGEPKLRGAAYTRWLAKVQSREMLLKDAAIPGMRALANCIAQQAGLIYLTGRSEIYREVTSEWLKKHNFPESFLLMRAKGSRTSAAALKEALIKQVVIEDNQDEVVVIDDDYTGELQEVCNRNGWTFLKCMTGGYFSGQK